MSSERTKLKLKYPASWWNNMWRDALPSGNGYIGAAVYGAVKTETIVINHGDLWHWGKKDTVPDVSHTLTEVRELMAAGQFMDASWCLTNALKTNGYSSRLASPFPLVSIRLDMSTQEGFKHYSRGLDMETGEVYVRWKEGAIDYERTLFVSRSHDMIVYELRSVSGLINITVALAVLDEGSSGAKKKATEISQSMECVVKDDCIYFAATNDDGTDYGAVLRVIRTGGKQNYIGSSIQLMDCENALILVNVFVKGDRVTQWPKLASELQSVKDDYAILQAAHVKLHKPFFQSASISLACEDDDRSSEELLLEAYQGEAPTALVEKMWAYGRYLFISGSACGGNPFHMYGLWAGDYNLMWSHHMANENMQMIYWHVLVGGLSELMQPFFTYYEKMMHDFHDNAQKLYGCRGIYIPAGTTPGIGVPNQVVPVIMNWTTAAGWLASHYYAYYLYTHDIEFLKSQALPFMHEVALFYEDFLELGDDGFYVYYPSVSPENTPANFMPGNESLAHPMPTTINATMDFAVMKELLRNVVQGSELTGLYKKDANRWRDMLTKIPPYQVNEEGAIREWMHPQFDDRYNHRHLSHIYPLFPGQEIHQESHPQLFKALEKAVRMRVLGAQTGWSLTHMACIYARLGDGNKALDSLNILSRSCLLPTLYTLHNDWRNMGVSMPIPTAPIQMDANMGWVNAVQEMILYSSPSLVKLLPACPDKWSKGEVSNLRFCLGSISFAWDFEKGTLDACILAERAGKIQLYVPKRFESYSIRGEGFKLESTSQDNSKLDIIFQPKAKLQICTV